MPYGSATYGKKKKQPKKKVVQSKNKIKKKTKK